MKYMKRDYLTTAFERIRGRMTRMGNDDDYYDALQDAFCRLWSRRNSIADPNRAEGLLTITARNIQVDNIRHRSRYPSVNVEDAMPIQDSDPENDNTAELYEEINKIISENLSERDRKILHLRDCNGWNFEEIAYHFGLSESNVRMILSRARKTVRDTYRKRRQ